MLYNTNNHNHTLFIVFPLYTIITIFAHRYLISYVLTRIYISHTHTLHKPPLSIYPRVLLRCPQDKSAYPLIHSAQAGWAAWPHAGSRPGPSPSSQTIIRIQQIHRHTQISIKAYKVWYMVYVVMYYGILIYKEA